VSIRPVPPGSAARKPYRPFGQSSSRGAMRPTASPHRPTHPPRAMSRPVSQPQSARQNFNFAPCSPFCPGVTGIPELECTQCHSLFHPKCVSIPAWQVASIQATFKCKRCAGVVGGKAEVINLDWRKDNFKYSKTSPIVHTCTAWTADTRKYWKILWPAASSDGNYLLPIPSSHFYCLKNYRKSNCLSLAIMKKTIQLCFSMNAQTY